MQGRNLSRRLLGTALLDLRSEAVFAPNRGRHLPTVVKIGHHCGDLSLGIKRPSATTPASDWRATKYAIRDFSGRDEATLTNRLDRVHNAPPSQASAGAGGWKSLLRVNL